MSVFSVHAGEFCLLADRRIRPIRAAVTRARIASDAPLDGPPRRIPPWLLLQWTHWLQQLSSTMAVRGTVNLLMAVSLDCYAHFRWLAGRLFMQHRTAVVQALQRPSIQRALLVDSVCPYDLLWELLDVEWVSRFDLHSASTIPDDTLVFCIQQVAWLRRPPGQRSKLSATSIRRWLCSERLLVKTLAAFFLTARGCQDGPVHRHAQWPVWAGHPIPARPRGSAPMPTDILEMLPYNLSCDASRRCMLQCDLVHGGAW